MQSLVLQSRYHRLSIRHSEAGELLAALNGVPVGSSFFSIELDGQLIACQQPSRDLVKRVRDLVSKLGFRSSDLKDVSFGGLLS